MNATTTMTLMCENGTVWIPSTSSWTGKDRLHASDIGKNDTDILDIIELGRKRIIPEDVRLELLRPRGQVNSLMTRLGKPFFLRGAWWVPNKNMVAVKEGLEKIQKTQDEIVQKLIDGLPELKKEMTAQYPILANADWPTEAKIRSQFSLTWHVVEVKGTSMKEADTEELIAAKTEFSNQLKQEYEDYKNQILTEAKQAIVEACNEIAWKVKDAGSRVTAATIRKPMKIIDDYLGIAEIFDLEDVRSEVQKVKDKLESASPQQLKTDWFAAKEFAKSMSEMAGKIGNLSGLYKDGTVMRVATRREREAV